MGVCHVLNRANARRLAAPLWTSIQFVPHRGKPQHSCAALHLECRAGSPVSTDAHAAYLDFEGNRLRRAQLLQGTSLKIGAETVFHRADRRDWGTE